MFWGQDSKSFDKMPSCGSILCLTGASGPYESVSTFEVVRFKVCATQER
jgi:hypothetical protein